MTLHRYILIGTIACTQIEAGSSLLDRLNKSVQNGKEIVQQATQSISNTTKDATNTIKKIIVTTPKPEESNAKPIANTDTINEIPSDESLVTLMQDTPQQKQEEAIIAQAVTTNPNEKPSLGWLVAASYAQPEEANTMMQRHGYTRDDDASTGETGVFYCRKENGSYNILVLFRGSQTESKSDWTFTDPMLGIGLLKKTPRYQRSYNRLKMAKAKYTVDNTAPCTILFGHSLGGALASELGLEKMCKNDYIITYNKGVGLANLRLTKKSNPNEIAYRTRGDIVSLIGKYNNNNIDLAPSKDASNIIKKHTDEKTTSKIEVDINPENN